MLKVVISNNNPVIPAALYLRAIKNQGLFPNLLKTDYESENGDIAAVHWFLTGNNLSRRYNASHANQSIKNWWLHFKRRFLPGLQITSSNVFTMAYLFVAMFLERTRNAFGLCMLVFFNVS